MPHGIQVIKDQAGAPIFAVLAWAEYERLCELLPGERGEEEIIRAISELPPEVRDQLSQEVSKLKVLREWRELSQVALSVRCNVSSQYISTLEKSRRSIGKHVAKKLAPALGVSIAVLMG